MPDADYYRSQAELYFELARRMSVRSDAEYCRATARRYAARAAELEAEAAGSSFAPNTSCATRSG
jgi:hypothetical protein